MTTDRENFELAVGLRATHDHVKRVLGPKRFKKMMARMEPIVNLRALATKVSPSAAAFQMAGDDNITNEERAMFVAVAVELKLSEAAENN